uniref:Uncharacterized protein n=1 Tax=Acrobeloides nanus TaxID=290746 RepID=A0A914DJ41_9BILA
MIDLLINEVDTHVSEIIERVQMESNNSSTGPTSRTVSPVATIMQQSATTALTSKESSVSRTQPPLQVSNAIVTTSNLSQSSNTSTNTNAAMKTPNVWQQRAAKLQQQKIVTPEFKSQAFLSKNTEIIKSLQSEIPPLFNDEEHQRKAPGYARPTFFARNPSPPSTEMAKTKKYN